MLVTIGIWLFRKSSLELDIPTRTDSWLYKKGKTRACFVSLRDTLHCVTMQRGKALTRFQAGAIPQNKQTSILYHCPSLRYSDITSENKTWTLRKALLNTWVGFPFSWQEERAALGSRKELLLLWVIFSPRHSASYLMLQDLAFSSSTSPLTCQSLPLPDVLLKGRWRKITWWSSCLSQACICNRVSPPPDWLLLSCAIISRVQCSSLDLPSVKKTMLLVTSQQQCGVLAFQ